jgi:PhnB protein
VALPTPPPVTPYLVVDDAKKAIDFYVRAFGAKELTRQATPDGKKLIHAALDFHGGLVMLCDDFPEMKGGKSTTPKALGGSAVTIHLDLPDVDSTWKQALAAGAEVRMPLADMFWGDRYGSVQDPFGHTWSLATRKRESTSAERDAGAQKYFGDKHGA